MKPGARAENVNESLKVHGERIIGQPRRPNGVISVDLRGRYELHICDVYAMHVIYKIDIRNRPREVSQLLRIGIKIGIRKSTTVRQ